jgi:hypothetical protein
MHEYAKAINACLAARAVWEPGDSVLPGDYGVIQHGCFVRLGSVADLGTNLVTHEIKNEGKYQFSRGLRSRQGMSATTAVEWTGEVLSSLDWAGGAGVFLGASKSSLLNIADLGRVVRETLTSKKWGFNWRLVRQVRTLTAGVIAVGGDAASAGKLSLTSIIPTHNANISADVERADGFLLLHRGVNGGVYVHTVRLRPWLSHGSAPLDHELWFDDDFDDE